MNEVHLVLTRDAVPVPWRNGGGLTRELLAWPAASDWLLRVSVAEIERDGPFSAYPGVDRWFVVLDGEGVVLGSGTQRLKLGTGSAPHHFDGEQAPDCALVRSATRDLNIMLRRDRAAGDFAPVLNSEPHFCAAGVHGLYTTQAGMLRRDDGAQWAIPAHALAWWAAPPEGVWRFTTEARSVRAWWLGCMPIGHDSTVSPS